MVDRAAFMESLWRSGVIVVQEDPITLKSGRVSHVYVNFRSYACAPEHLTRLTAVFGAWLNGRKVAVGTVASLLSPVLAGAVSAALGLPLVLTRADSSEKGLAGALFASEQELPVVLLDDVLTSGGTALRAADLIAASGRRAVFLFVFVDKRPVSLRAAFTLPVAAPLTLIDLLQFGLTQGYVEGQAADYAREELLFLES